MPDPGKEAYHERMTKAGFRKTSMLGLEVYVGPPIVGECEKAPDDSTAAVCEEKDMSARPSFGSFMTFFIIGSLAVISIPVLSYLRLPSWLSTTIVVALLVIGMTALRVCTRHLRTMGSKDNRSR